MHETRLPDETREKRACGSNRGINDSSSHGGPLVVLFSGNRIYRNQNFPPVRAVRPSATAWGGNFVSANFRFPAQGLKVRSYKFYWFENGSGNLQFPGPPASGSISFPISIFRLDTFDDTCQPIRRVAGSQHAASIIIHRIGSPRGNDAGCNKVREVSCANTEAWKIVST